MSTTPHPSTTLFPHDNLYADVYDSVRQHECARLQDFGVAYLGRLRLDLLFNRTVTLTDSQLLDGTFFLKYSASSLVDCVRRHHRTRQRRDDRSDADPSIIVRHRGASLEEALLGFVISKQSTKHFRFSTIENPVHALDVARRLASLSVGDLDSQKKLAAAIRSALPDAESHQADELEAHWRGWLNLYRNRERHRDVIRFEPWDNFAFDLKYGRSLEPPEEVREALETEEEQLLFDQALMLFDSRPRSEVLDFLDARAAISPELQPCAHSLKGWVNRVYNRTAAVQHGCSSFESSDDGSVVLSRLQEIWLGRVQYSGSDQYSASYNISVPESFLVALGEMPAEQFRDCFTAGRDGFRKWWDLPATKNSEGNFLVRPTDYARRLRLLDDTLQCTYDKAGVPKRSILSVPVFSATVRFLWQSPIALLMQPLAVIGAPFFGDRMRLTRRIVEHYSRRSRTP